MGVRGKGDKASMSESESVSMSMCRFLASAGVSLRLGAGTGAGAACCEGIVCGRRRQTVVDGEEGSVKGQGETRPRRVVRTVERLWVWASWHCPGFARGSSLFIHH